MSMLTKIMAAVLILVPAGEIRAESGTTHPVKQPSVLVLFSYAPSFKWTKQEMQGIMDAFDSEGLGRARISAEYLNVTRDPSPENLEDFAGLIRSRYKSDIDLIMCCDNDAIFFMVNQGKDILPSVPVVFCGLNQLNADLFNKNRVMTGVVEFPDVQTNVDLMLKIRPGTKKIFVISDYHSPSSIAVMEQVAPILKEAEKKGLKIEIAPDVSTDEIIKKVSRLDDDTQVLLLQYKTDNTNTPVDVLGFVKKLSQNCQVPIVGLWDIYLDNGIVGGYMVEGYQQGYEMGRLAAQVLSGMNPATMPLVRNRGNRYEFDFFELQRFDIPPSILPAGSNIINTHYRLQKHGIAITVMGCLLGLCAVLLVPLTIAYFRNRHVLKKLEITDRMIQQIIDAVPACMVAADTEKRILFANKACVEMMGLPIGKIIGKSISELIGSKDVMAVADDALASGMPRYKEILHRMPDGKMATCQTFMRPAQINNGPGLIIYGLDVSQYKQTETQLKKLETQREQILNSLSDGVILLDGSLNIIWANKQADEMLDAPIGQLIGKKCFTFKNHKIPCRECAALSTIRSKEPHSCVLEINNKNILIKSVPVIDDDGNLISVVETLQDISSQVKARKEAVNKMEMFQSLLDMLPAGVFIIDHERHIVNANRYALDLLGILTFDDIKGTLCHKRICPEAEPNCPLVNPDKKVESTPCKLMTIHGEELPVLKTVRPVNYMGEEMMVEVFLDMRQHEMYVDNLLQSEKLQAVAQFAKGLAGEFSNKTSDILSRINSLKKDLNDNKNIRSLEAIRKTVSQISEITDKLMAFSRMDLLGSSQVDMHEVIQHVTVYMEHTLRDDGIALKTNLSARHHLIIGDSLQLERSILNLCSNSKNAMPNGGTLIISTSNENVDESSQLHAIRKLPVGRYLRIQVIDTGHGITPEVQSHIFEPFFSTRSTSTGVGLSAVFGTIKSHNGSIDVNSTPGLGTTFNIYLPVTSKTQVKESTSDGKSETTEIDNGEYEILVVDDDQIARTIISEMLRRLGYGVLNASSGKEAVEIYLSKRSAISLILLDITMPDMSGGEVFDILREKDPDVKIMILSADFNEKHVNYILNAGGMGYLSKPVTQKNLQVAIARAMSGMMTLPADLKN